MPPPNTVTSVGSLLCQPLRGARRCPRKLREEVSWPPEHLNNGPENRFRVSTRDDKKVLEPDGHGHEGGTAVWRYITPLDCTPENGYSGKFYIVFV